MRFKLSPAGVKRLRRWLAASFQSRSYLRFDGFPIDRIDETLFARESWLDGGAAVFMAARTIRDELSYPLTVAVTFGLVPAAGPESPALPRREQLTDQLDEEAPSLTLFPATPDFLDDVVSDAIDPALLIVDPPIDVKALRREWSFPEDEGGEIFRSLLLYSLPRTPD